MLFKDAFKNSQNGLAQVFVLIILFSGLFATLYLSQKTQIFQPRAYDQIPPFYNEESLQMRYFENKVGWAYTAFPRVSREQMIEDMKRMKSLGMNVVYISHANPGNINPDGDEPGLNPALYFSIRDKEVSSSDAQLIYQAIIDALEASKIVGLDVVLPVGYQIQMGETWSIDNPQHLRLNKNGERLYNWATTNTASPYSPRYLADIKEYYQWVNDNFVSKYPNIVAINLADEPMGSDFSQWAKDEFKLRYNIGFDSASSEMKGEFISGVIADYATSMANLWKEINPQVWTMMTFHIQREQPWVPNMEFLFQRTPTNFLVSADTHLHDALPNLPLTESEIDHLYGMVRTLSYLSKVYNKKLMLWTSANAWGLTYKGGIKEAERNLQIIQDASRQGGGKVAMIMAWGWNIKNQGVYRCEGHCSFDPEEMIRTVSSKLSSVRDGLSDQKSSSPSKVIYLSSLELNRMIGEERVDHLASPYIDLNRHNLASENIVYLSDGLALRKAKESGAKIINALE